MRGRVSLVPQQDALFDHLSASSFLEFAARTHGVADPEHAAARCTGDGRTRRRRAQAGRVSSPRGCANGSRWLSALVNDPEVLILDEPLTGLDPVQRRNMIALFHRLGDEGRCVLVSSHVLDEVAKLGSRVLVIAQGRLVASGDYRDLRELMDDRAHRIRVGASDPRRLAAALVERGLVSGVSIDDRNVMVDTLDVDAFGRQLASAECRTRGAAHRGQPARRRPRVGVPVPGGGSMTELRNPVDAEPSPCCSWRGGRAVVSASCCVSSTSRGRIIGLSLLALIAPLSALGAGERRTRRWTTRSASSPRVGFGSGAAGRVARLRRRRTRRTPRGQDAGLPVVATDGPLADRRRCRVARLRHIAAPITIDLDRARRRC